MKKMYSRVRTRNVKQQQPKLSNFVSDLTFAIIAGIGWGIITKRYNIFECGLTFIILFVFFRELRHTLGLKE